MPRENTAARVTRLLALLAYLGERDCASVAELAGQFDVSESQIIKDIDLLWLTGLPGYGHGELIDFSVSDYDDSVISLREAQGLDRPVPFAPREALALMVAVECLKALGGTNLAALSSVQEKLRGLVPADIRAPLPPSDALQQTIREAIERGRALKLRYVSAEDAETVRIIEPRVIFTDGAHWYLDAWCHRARAERSFRFDRMLSLSLGRRPSGSRPPASDGTDHAAGRDSTAPASHAPSHPPTVPVRLLLDPAARWLAEEIPGARATEVVVAGETLLEVVVAATRTDWLVRRLLGLGRTVRQISPAALRLEVADRAERALQLYGP